MPRISRDERSCAFCNEFGQYSEYFDDLANENYKEKKTDPFVDQMAQVLHDASSLDQGDLSKAIKLVDTELKRQLEVGHAHDKLSELHTFLERVQQSEVTYFAMRKAERQERNLQRQETEREDLRKRQRRD